MIHVCLQLRQKQCWNIANALAGAMGAAVFLTDMRRGTFFRALSKRITISADGLLDSGQPCIFMTGLDLQALAVRLKAQWRGIAGFLLWIELCIELCLEQKMHAALQQIEPVQQRNKALLQPMAI